MEAARVAGTKKGRGEEREKRMKGHPQPASLSPNPPPLLTPATQATGKAAKYLLDFILSA